MSELENRKKKKPVVKTAYRSLIRPELADELYEQILRKIVVEKMYKNPKYSAKELAKDLNTNTRYLSAVINSRFGMNYPCLINEYRIKDAMNALVDKRYVDTPIEDICSQVGFTNRQTFYLSFYRFTGYTPHQYRKHHSIFYSQLRNVKK